MNEAINIIEKAALNVFADIDKAEKWLSTPLPAQNHRTPNETALAGDGEIVLKLLRKVEYGEFC